MTKYHCGFTSVPPERSRELYVEACFPYRKFYFAGRLFSTGLRKKAFYTTAVTGIPCAAQEHYSKNSIRWKAIRRTLCSNFPIEKLTDE